MTKAEILRYLDEIQEFQPLVAKAFAEMGIHGEAIEAELAQKMITACGVRPQDNLLSQGIVEMREE